MDKSKKIGFMGLGIMGQPMVRNILKAGFAVAVYNRDRSKAAGVVEAGATLASSPRELAAGSDVVVAMLTGPEALYSLLFGQGEEGGAAEGLAGKVFVNMSTVSPSFTRQLHRELAGRGIRFVDAPVSGSRKPAEEAGLVILAGGDKDLVDDLSPLFLAMGKKVVYCGPEGSGSMMKMTANLLLGSMMAGLCEAVNFGEKGGLDKAAVLDALLSGPMGCGLFKLKEEMLKAGDYPAQFPLKHMLKDIKFVSDTAYETGAATPGAHSVLLLYRQAMAHGLGDLDFAAVMKTLQEAS